MVDFTQIITNLFSAYALYALVKIVFTLVLAFVLNYLINWYVAKQQGFRGLDRRAIRQIGLIARYLTFLIAFWYILVFAGVTPTVMLTSLGIVGIAVGFAAQDILSNLLAGVFLIFENTIKVSDIVKVGDVYGIVRIIKLRTTEIRTFDNNIVNIPNSELAKSNIVNMTSGSRYLMTSITVKLGYEADYDLAEELIRAVINRVDGVIVDSTHGIRFELGNIGERYHGLNLICYFFVEAINEPWIRSTAHQRIIESLIENKVPFHRDSPK